MDKGKMLFCLPATVIAHGDVNKPQKKYEIATLQTIIISYSGYSVHQARVFLSFRLLFGTNFSLCNFID
jgi:hypothetical protein